MHALRSGADGFLLAGRPTEGMLSVVRQALAGESPIAPEIARQLLAHVGTLNARPIASGGFAPQGLDRRERLLLQWVCEGYMTHEIARGMGITSVQVGVRVRTPVSQDSLRAACRVAGGLRRPDNALVKPWAAQYR